MADSWRDRMQWVLDTYAEGNAAELARQVSEKMGRKVQGQTVSAWIREEAPTTPGGAFLEAILRLYPTINPVYLVTGEGVRTRTREGVPDAYKDGATDAIAVMRETLTRLEGEIVRSTSTGEGGREVLARYQEVQRLVESTRTDQGRRKAQGDQG